MIIYFLITYSVLGHTGYYLLLTVDLHRLQQQPFYNPLFLARGETGTSCKFSHLNPRTMTQTLYVTQNLHSHHSLEMEWPSGWFRVLTILALLDLLPEWHHPHWVTPPGQWGMLYSLGHAITPHKGCCQVLSHTIMTSEGKKAPYA